jgi:hypothetical protein
MDRRGQRNRAGSNILTGLHAQFHATGPSERNLLPAPTEAVIEHPGQPVNITASGISIPHPEKVQKTRTKGVNARVGGSLQPLNKGHGPFPSRRTWQ